MKYTGAKILIESLIKNGVDTIFGLPGSAVLHIYDELYKYKDKIRHILVSHEQHAAHAADGYARSTGKTGVCLATSGPGATNLVTGIATAFVDSVPIVVITGNVGTSLLGKDSFQEVDIAGITMPIVKHNWIVEDVNNLAEIINEAFIVAQAGRPGPVLIDIPKDISSAVCDVETRINTEVNNRAERLLERTKRQTFNDIDLEKVITLIKNSKYPMIFAGGGIIRSGASAELKKLAEILGSPVALSFMGMGGIPHDHPLCTGLIGMHGTIASSKALQNSDLLITLGARFSDRVTNGVKQFALNTKIIHIDIDPAEINKNVSSDAFIIGDLKEVLTQLLKKIPAGFSSEWNGEIDTWKSETLNKKPEASKKTKTNKAALHPSFVIRETAKALGENAIIVTDVGQHQIWTAQYYPFKNPGSFLSSGGMGTMGFGMGAAAGAKIANQNFPVVLFTGDGCFRMNSAEMATLVKYKLPVLIIVFNNGTLGMLRQWQKLLFKANYYETNLDNNNPDFVKLAAAYDVPAFRSADEVSFLRALEKSSSILTSGKPVLIEVIVNKDVQASIVSI
ncbi:MAG: biosynthetic-type acetolactate synthase large subunit [Treponema sp.]|nr:biosynthetic-type acetolactate synthase large subunit [Treponema sp.]